MAPDVAPRVAVLGVIRETAPSETRVALVPEDVAKLTEAGLDVRVEQGAGENATYGDEEYVKAGAHIERATAILPEADILAVVRPPADPLLLGSLKPGAAV